jgi:alcohol dehydrogenase
VKTETGFTMDTSSIKFGPGMTRELGYDVARFGCRRVMLVTDERLAALPPVQTAIQSLNDANIEAVVFDQVRTEPTDASFSQAIEFASTGRFDGYVAVGGGSVMDTAKAANLYATYPADFLAYVNAPIGRAEPVPGPLKPLVAVPTTAGTGSESQSFALISDSKSHVKMACGDKKASFRVAVLDPLLTVTQPARVTALTGIDAISHALESYVTKVRNSASAAFSREAWRLLSRNFERVLAEPENVDARSGMQLGACFAGVAIENSMLGAAHALANPLTTHFDIVHGEAIALMLPHVIRFNGEQCRRWYHELLELAPQTNGEIPIAEAPEKLAGLVAKFATSAGLPSRLSERGIDAAALGKLATDAAKQWTGSFNPRPVDEAALAAIYEAAL